MAKGNMLLGMTRGSVGDVNFSVVKGQQVQKRRNREPANPRTIKQCFQRARFAAAVKFYTRGNRALFKFAFENRKQVESDYNAFMRENVKIAPAISKAAFDNYEYPVIAPFIVSKGSLQPIACSFNGTQAIADFGVPTSATSITTVGALSQALVASGQYYEGDIITLLFCTSSFNGEIPGIEGIGEGNTRWNIKQFVLDSASTELIAGVAGMTFTTVDGNVALTATDGTAPLDATYTAFTVIHSRNLAGGLKCSTQEITLNDAALLVYEQTQIETYKEAVAASWKTAGAVNLTPDAILQGSIALAESDIEKLTPYITSATADNWQSETLPYVIAGSGEEGPSYTIGSFITPSAEFTGANVGKFTFKSNSENITVTADAGDVPELVDGSNRSISFNLYGATPPAGAPVGEYSIRAYYEGKLFALIEWEIEEAGE